MGPSNSLEPSTPKRDDFAVAYETGYVNISISFFLSHLLIAIIFPLCLHLSTVFLCDLFCDPNPELSDPFHRADE